MAVGTIPLHPIEQTHDFSWIGEAADRIGGLVAKYPELKRLQREEIDKQQNKQDLITKSRQYVETVANDASLLEDFAANRKMDVASAKKYLQDQAGSIKASSSDSIEDVWGNVSPVLQNVTTSMSNKNRAATAQFVDNFDRYQKFGGEAVKAAKLHLDELGNKENYQTFTDEYKRGVYTDTPTMTKRANELGVNLEDFGIQSILKDQSAKDSARARSAQYQVALDTIEKATDDFWALPMTQRYLRITANAPNLDEIDKKNIWESLLKREEARQFDQNLKVEWYKAGTDAKYKAAMGKKLNAEISNMNTEKKQNLLGHFVSMLNAAGATLADLQERLAQTKDESERAVLNGQIKQAKAYKDGLFEATSIVSQQLGSTALDPKIGLGQAEAIESGAPTIGVKQKQKQKPATVESLTDLGYTPSEFESDYGNIVIATTPEGEVSSAYVDGRYYPITDIAETIHGAERAKGSRLNSEARVEAFRTGIFNKLKGASNPSSGQQNYNYANDQKR